MTARSHSGEVATFQGGGSIQGDAGVCKYNWYAIRVASNCEKLAALALRNRGIEEYLPVYRRWRSYNGKLREVDLPLFPGYVFGRFDVNNRLPVLLIPGVVHIVGSGKVPVAVEGAELAAIKKVLESQLPVQRWPFLEVGDRVVIERGPLMGLEGILLQLRGGCRLIVSVTLLQRSVAVEMDREAVRPVRRRICLAPSEMAVMSRTA